MDINDARDQQHVVELEVCLDLRRSCNLRVEIRSSFLQTPKRYYLYGGKYKRYSDGHNNDKIYHTFTATLKLQAAVNF